MSKSYDTEIISVGTELLLGHVTNTDARDISEMLSKIGINVKYHTVVGDNPERLRKCVETAKSRADIIITTGGLGPTCDDLTKQILAEAFGLRLVENKAEREGLYDYIRYGKKFTDNNFTQAMLPEGCAMFRESALPYLRKLSEELIVSHSVRIFGLGESSVDDIFAEEMNRMTNPTMAPYAKECDCLLQITAKAKSVDEAEKIIAPVMEHVMQRLGDVVYGVDVECIEESVIKLLREKNMTFSAAESCTGGELAKRFTDMPGASAFFKGGVVTYTNEAKAKLLGIDTALIEEKGAVSYEVAKAMAENVRALLGTDIGVGVTGLAGPDGDGVHEVGTVFVSLAVEGETFVKELHMGAMRTRSFIRRMAGNHIYDMMRRWLSSIDVM